MLHEKLLQGVHAVVRSRLGSVEEACHNSSRVHNHSVNELALFMCFELLLDCLAEVIGKTFGRDICSPEPRKLPNHRNA